jgi:surface protein
LDGQDRGGKYRVRVKGDIAGSQKISIVPDASFTMSEVNASVDKKADITASVEQGKTEWNQTEINKDDYNDEIGTITADDISAGSWSGTFNFNTKLENTVPKKKTYVLKKGSDFKNLIPSSATSVVFTDEVIPSDATVIDVDEDGDGGVVGWLDGTVFKVSTQKSGQKVVANTDASKMFYYCPGLTTLDLSGLDTSKVTDMSYMFYGCFGLTTLDLSGFDTSNVTDMRIMFYGCSGLTTLDLSGFDTSNVTYMREMFCGDKHLTTIYIGDKWKTVSSHDDMFSGCGTSTLTHK